MITAIDQKSQRDLLFNKASNVPSLSSSVTVSPAGHTPLATPTASGSYASPRVQNVEEESEESTSIDELRNFLTSGSFPFTGQNSKK